MSKQSTKNCLLGIATNADDESSPSSTNKSIENFKSFTSDIVHGMSANNHKREALFLCYYSISNCLGPRSKILILDDISTWQYITCDFFL